MAFEAGDDVVWLKASTRGRKYGQLVLATVLHDDGRGQVQIEARMPQSPPVRRWVAATRLRPRRWLVEDADSPQAST